MIKEKFGDRLDGWLHTAFPFLFTWSLNPNALSVCGAVVSVAAAVAFGYGELRLGGVLVLAGGFFDLVDGVVARAQDRSTTFGAFLDSTLDRLVDVALLSGLAIHYALQGAVLVAVTCSVALTATVLVSYAKARAETFIERLDVGLMERGERIVLLAIGALLGFLPVALVVVAVGSVVTVGQRMAVAYREMERLDAGAVAANGDPEGGTTP